MVDGHHENKDDLDTLLNLYDAEYWKYLSDDSHLESGRTMLKNWYNRQDWSDRKVVSCEVKNEFSLPTPLGPVPVRYVFDRLDWVSPASEFQQIEVVDYKTVALPISADEMRQRIQVRVYALAAQLAYPDVQRIWVTYDLLRYESVSVAFSKEDNRETFKYLKALAERIQGDPGDLEQLNPDCRYCPRKHVCKTLKSYEVGTGGVTTSGNVYELADKRAKLDYAAKAIKSKMEELDTAILHVAEEENLTEIQSEDTQLQITASGKRLIDAERAAKILGPELMQRYGHIGITDVDRVLKDSAVSDEKKSALKQMVRKQYGNPYIKTKPKFPIEE